MKLTVYVFSTRKWLGYCIVYILKNCGIQAVPSDDPVLARKMVIPAANPIQAVIIDCWPPGMIDFPFFDLARDLILGPLAYSSSRLILLAVDGQVSGWNYGGRVLNEHQILIRLGDLVELVKKLPNPSEFGKRKEK